MHYPDSKDRSAELLRQAIPMMAQHPAPLHPITYAVWYDYLAGRNAGLKAEMDQVVARQVPMSDALVYTLYRRHILESAAETAQKVSDGLRAVIDEVGTTATLTGERVSEFTASLQEKSGRMASLGMPANLGVELDALLTDSRDTGASLSTLMQRLQAATSELAKLRVELDQAKVEIPDSNKRTGSKPLALRDLGEFALGADELPERPQLVAVRLLHGGTSRSIKAEDRRRTMHVRRRS